MRRWGRRDGGGGGDLPADTFDGSEATPSPSTDPDRNWVDQFIVISTTLLDPSRLANRRYQCRVGLVAGLLFAVDAVVAFALGAPWFALGCLLIGAAVFLAIRFLRIPLVALWAAIALVFLFVLPLDGDVGGSAATQAATCPWMSTGEAVATVGRDISADPVVDTAHCSWSTVHHASVPARRVDRLALDITDPLVAPSPTASDTLVPTVGLRAWTAAACTSTSCTEQLSVVLSSTYLTIDVTSTGVDQAQWLRQQPRLVRRMTHLGSVLAPRVSPPQD